MKKQIAIGLILALAVVILSGCTQWNIYPAEVSAHEETRLSESSEAVKETQKETETSAPATETSKVTEPTESKAPATEVAPKTEGTAMELTQKLRYRTNIFLSDFSEQWFHEQYSWDETSKTRTLLPGKFETRSADIMEIAEYCWMFAKINLNQAELVYYGDEAYYGVSMSNIDAIAMRFFNVHVTEDSIPQNAAFPSNGLPALLIDGKLCCMAAEGETYNHMSVVDSVTDLGNGRVQVQFSIYEINDIGGDGCIVLASGLIQDRSVYYYTTEQAENHTAFSHYADGVAVMDYSLKSDGDVSYKLVSYELLP